MMDIAGFSMSLFSSAILNLDDPYYQLLPYLMKHFALPLSLYSTDVNVVVYLFSGWTSKANYCVI